MNANTTSPYAALILRLSLGSMFLAHAGLKYVVFTLAGAAGFFGSLGLPPALAYATFFLELIVGVALVAGIQTRLAALVGIPILAGTIVFVHGASGWVFSNPGGGWEYPAFLIAASLVQALIGDGAFALSRVLSGKRRQDTLWSQAVPVPEPSK
ncbi:Predicted membrane protein [Desulfosarcina cetonica]|uniref:DoxX family protein n=1 Tax=Desulfosarcina cetonica TaxID=90730 RepID=UPI0006CF6EDB|nr:DoxX family protein [Desulfosarcina cetonica]VTR69569.1 Predicted membrane protein [Desulfosarcina cetonica]